MYAPTKSWRRWQRKTNLNLKRYAVASSLAVSTIPALIMSRGHRIENVPEIPLVLENSVESITSSSKANNILKAVGAFDDVSRVTASHKIRAGKGKFRNRRYLVKKGPIMVYSRNKGISKGFRNLAGVETINVSDLSILNLAPGGHLGRFIIWTKSAVEAINTLWSTPTMSSTVKKAYILPRSVMTNSELKRLINSNEVQSILNPPKKTIRSKNHKKNPLQNKIAYHKLSPYTEKKIKRKKINKTHGNAISRHFYNQLISDSEYLSIGCDGFRSWLSLNNSQYKK
jgi:large subunit ribosomal protein L4e